MHKHPRGTCVHPVYRPFFRRRVLAIMKCSVVLFLVLAATRTAGAQNGAFNVLKIPPLASAPAYFYMDTNIPATDATAPQLQITGYTYAATNKALKFTLGWYYYAGNFYWTQYQSDLGYAKPSRVRLGKYTKNGADYIRVEISNNSIYWANYNVMATDIGSYLAAEYTGWTYAEGEMPAATTTQITTVNPQPNVVVEGRLGIGTSQPDQALTVNGTVHASEVLVNTNIPVPDYVFDKTYKLASLTELQAYIARYHHLPKLLPAAQVEKEGIALGEMNTRLLEKVEELTLYLIAQNKKLAAQQRAVNTLRRQVRTLSKQHPY